MDSLSQDKPKTRQNSDIDGTLQRTVKKSALLFFQIAFADFLKDVNFGEIDYVTPIAASFPIKKTLNLDSLFEFGKWGSLPSFVNLEYQSLNEQGLIVRLHEYFSSFLQYLFDRFGKDYKIEDFPKFYQFCLYVGDEPMTMPSSFIYMGFNFEVIFIDIRNLRVDDFLNSKNPEMIVLAILVFRTVGNEEAYKVIKKLEELNLDKNVLLSSLQDIFELSIKRAARAVIKNQIETIMPNESRELVLADPFFQEGKREGIQEGEKKGLEKGIKEGIKEGEKKGLKLAKFSTAKMMIKKGYPIEEIQMLNNLTDTEWQEFLKTNQNE